MFSDIDDYYYGGKFSSQLSYAYCSFLCCDRGQGPVWPNSRQKSTLLQANHFSSNSRLPMNRESTIFTLDRALHNFSISKFVSLL